MLESAKKLVPGEFAYRHNLMPFAMDSSTIWVAMSDPANIAVVDEIRFRTGRRVQIALAGDHEIGEAVRRHYLAGQVAGQGPQAAQSIPLDVDAGSVDPDSAPPGTAVEQFGGGSTATFDDFFSRPPEPAPVPAPAAELFAPGEPPSPGGDGAVFPAIDLEDLLPEEAPAPLAPPSLVERPPADPQGNPGWTADQGDLDSIELPLEEVDPGQPGSGQHAVLEALDRLVQGEWVAPEVVKPAQMMAALVRLLLQKKIISEEEFLAEFQRK